MSTFDPFQGPAPLRVAAWSLRLTTHQLPSELLLADPQNFALWYASVASCVEPPKELRATSPIQTTEGSSIILATLKDLQRQFGSHVTSRFTNHFLEGLEVYYAHQPCDNPSEVFAPWREKVEKLCASTISSLETNLDRLGNLLNLSEEERRLLLFQYSRTAPGFAHFFDAFLPDSVAQLFFLGVMLDIPYARLFDLTREESPLVASGLLNVQERPFSLGHPSRYLEATLTLNAETDDEFFERFVTPLTPKAMTTSFARLEERDEQVLVKLLKLPLSPGGHHVLVYGSPTLDKRDLLARICEREDLKVFVVNDQKVPASDRPVWTHVAQAYLKGRANTVLVIDHAEQVLTSRSVSLRSFFGLEELPDDDDKASDEGLTSAALRCVWLTNKSQSLSESNIGRFIFHVEALPGSRADRRQRVAQALEDAAFGPDVEAALAKYSLLGEKPVRQALRLINLVEAGNDLDARRETLQRAVHQSQRALGRDATEDLRESVTTYDLGFLNLNTRFTPQQIVTSLRERQAGSLLFHGIPGAGKTQFAEYLAVELDRPLLVKRASDILSKWLGESEQHIAAMFKEAEEEGAILFLDEADSLLRDRSLARAEWSVTQVNELLQHLERAKGVVICATNLMNDIDAAAMRRFTFKIEFLPLHTDQAWRMFVGETGIDERTANPDDLDVLRARLREIPNLAPGDFATVKRMSLILANEEPFSPSDWLDQLAREAKDKMRGLERYNSTGAYL